MRSMRQQEKLKSRECGCVRGHNEGKTDLVLSDRDPWDYVVCLALAGNKGRPQGEGHARLCNDNGDVTPHIELAVAVGGGYLDTSVFETFLEGLPKNGALARRQGAWG